jgi:hypothetical protein
MKLNRRADFSDLVVLSSLFYTIVPIFSRMAAPPIIDDLNCCIRLRKLLRDQWQSDDVDVSTAPMSTPSLGNVDVALQSILMHPLDCSYSSLNCSIQCLEPGLEVDMLHNLIVGFLHARMLLISEWQLL